MKRRVFSKNQGVGRVFKDLFSSVVDRYFRSRNAFFEIILKRETTVVSFLLLTLSMAANGLPPLPGSGKVKNVSLDATSALAEPNPYRLPGDDHVFRLREEEVPELNSCLRMSAIISSFY
jgi:hypothetical protein